jgi:2-iminobutanoate/2-iminopropanoate deaminase
LLECFAMKEKQLPPAVGPYVLARRAGDLLFLSGQIPLNPETKQLVVGGIEEQTEQALDNIQAIIEANGATMEEVVRVEIYLKDLSDFGKVNALYAKRFSTQLPVRQTMEVARLPLDAKIEISCIVDMSL